MWTNFDHCFSAGMEFEPKLNSRFECSLVERAPPANMERGVCVIFWRKAVTGARLGVMMDVVEGIEKGEGDGL